MLKRGCRLAWRYGENAKRQREGSEARVRGCDKVTTREGGKDAQSERKGPKRFRREKQEAERASKQEGQANDAGGG